MSKRRRGGGAGRRRARFHISCLLVILCEQMDIGVRLLEKPKLRAEQKSANSTGSLEARRSAKCHVFFSKVGLVELFCFHSLNCCSAGIVSLKVSPNEHIFILSFRTKR